MNSRRLHNVFLAYTGGSPTITSAKFSKLVKDATLLSSSSSDSSLSQSEVDLIFTKNKEKGQRTLHYEAFKRALEMIAVKKEVSPKDLAEFLILKCGEGPRLTDVTKAQENRFYDDKSTYTGVHKAGGPTTVDKEKQQLHQLLDRSSADVRGLKQSMKESYQRDTGSPVRRQAPRTPGSSQSHQSQAHHPSHPSQAHRSPPAPPSGSHTPTLDQDDILGSLEKRLQQTSLGSRGSSSEQSSPEPPQAPHEARRSPLLPPKPPQDSEKELFRIYKTFCCNQDACEMDSFRFVRLCKDVGFIGPANHMSTTDADLIFQKSKRAGNYGKRICYEDFRLVTIPEMAKRMQCSAEDVIDHIVMSNGPTFHNVTHADNVRFHDDTTTYTGVKGRSGGVNPSYSVEQRNVAMEDLLDRSEADARGVRRVSGGRKPSSKPSSVVMAGEANKKGGIFDRLTDQSSYTGVYKERFTHEHPSDEHYDISQLVQRR